MTLTELTQEVYTITNRPDRINETASAIRAATLKMHQSDYYWKDLLETGISFDAACYQNDIEFRTLLPLFRAIKYLKKLHCSCACNAVLRPYQNYGSFNINWDTSRLGVPLTLLEPGQLFDDYHQLKQDVFYAAGAVIHINSSTLEQNYVFGCYVNPDITTSGYNSWVALDQPYAIIYEACAMVFKAIGKDEEAANYKNLMAEQIAMLKTNNIIAGGF